MLALPFDYPQPDLQSTDGAAFPFAFSAHLSQAIKDFSQSEGVTVFMTLLTVVNVLLLHYSGQEDIVIGSPIANRTRSEIEGLIGFFVNTLALRTNMAGQPSFHEAVQRVHEVTLNAYAHQDVPFEMVVEAVQPRRNLSHTPLFQVFLALENASSLSLNFSDVPIAPLPLEKNTAKFSLFFSFLESDDGLSGTLEYCAGLFAFSTIERLVAHLEILLERLLSHPHVPVMSFALPDEYAGRRDHQAENSKIEQKRSLPSDDTPPDSLQPYIPPQTETEQKIAAIWQEVLHKEKIGIYDNFFDCGGMPYRKLCKRYAGSACQRSITQNSGWHPSNVLPLTPLLLICNSQWRTRYRPWTLS
jgi:non-ribosomal peptide synthetase component F